MFGDSVLQNLIPESIPGHTCLTNMGRFPTVTEVYVYEM